MATDVDDSYDGSKIFIWVSDYSGLPIDQINFLISQFLALGLAPLFRTALHPSTTNPATRHAVGLVLGLALGYFCFGIRHAGRAGRKGKTRRTAVLGPEFQGALSLKDLFFSIVLFIN
uniref:Uncharacterized protein n=1 Tax=Timema cristinae TaxID=61476 RepID=A0A7R9D1X0_TIMCR|nr:unnamed protein product [Timema cristinae]